MKRRVARLRPLKQMVRYCGAISSRSFSSFSLVRRPSVSKPLRGGDSTVRMGIGVWTLFHDERVVG